MAFVWNLGCQSAFEALKGALVVAPVLIRPDFEKQFCLDVDWSPKGIGAILSQKEGRSCGVRQQRTDICAEEIPSHGGRMLCTDLGHYALQAVSASHPLCFEDGSQAIGVVGNGI